jgi:ABC-type uncharacterized transport system permease subunit
MAAELLFVPAVLAYGEAAVAYVGETRHPGLPGRLAIWGVRVGWIAQTLLLVVQAVRADGFPWADWAGALNLFVWLVVGAYLIWGCKPRFRLLGLAVMPPAAILLALAWAGEGASESDRSTPFLVLHVGLVLAGFAGFTLAAGLAATYLWTERRLKRHEAGIFRIALPPLDALDRLAARTALASFCVLTLGIAVGLGALGPGELDTTIVVTTAAWLLYAAFLVLRWGLGWRGRRSARVLVLGAALVVLVLPLAHFAS